jgi:hypothetical protein
MKPGTLISGAAHGALIAAAIFGLPWLTPRDREPIAVTTVTFVSDAEFEAARSASSAPAEEASEQVTLPAEVALEPEMPVVEPPEPAPSREQAAEAAPSETFTPRFNPAAPLSAPTEDFAAVSPDLIQPEAPSRVNEPRPRPVPRLVPEPLDEPAEELPEAVLPTPEVLPSPQETEILPEEDAAAPPESAPEIVTEPAPQAPQALQNAGRPRSRPERISEAPRQVANAPEAEAAPALVEPPAEEPPAEEPAPLQSLQSQLSELVAAATPATPPTSPTATAPTRPSPGQGGLSAPISASEKEGMKLAVQRCWNLPAGLREAQELKVTVGAELTVTGEVIDGSVRLVEPNPAPDDRYQRAFDAGRRALIRCAPYTGLPPDKYDQWRRLEIVFNPEGMVSW